MYSYLQTCVSVHMNYDSVAHTGIRTHIADCLFNMLPHCQISLTIQVFQHIHARYNRTCACVITVYILSKNQPQLSALNRANHWVPQMTLNKMPTKTSGHAIVHPQTLPDANATTHIYKHMYDSMCMVCSVHTILCCNKQLFGDLCENVGKTLLNMYKKCKYNIYIYICTYVCTYILTFRVMPCRKFELNLFLCIFELLKVSKPSSAL